MALPFRNILCPVDFEDNSMEALVVGAGLARQNDATLFVLHVVPMIIPPHGQPIFVDTYKGHEETAQKRLKDIAHRQLRGLKYELSTYFGDPATAILKAAKTISADLIVMATHGRRGFSHFFLGSVTEVVVRDSTCPVLTVRTKEPKKALVESWMTRNPVTATPDETLASVHVKMLEGGFRNVPVIRDGAPVGIVTDRDLRSHIGLLENTAAFKAMSEPLITVTPSTSVREAARLLRERKLGGLPVVEDGKLIGVITTTDVLDALTAED